MRSCGVARLDWWSYRWAAWSRGTSQRVWTRRVRPPPQADDLAETGARARGNGEPTAGGDVTFDAGPATCGRRCPGAGVHDALTRLPPIQSGRAAMLHKLTVEQISALSGGADGLHDLYVLIRPRG